MKKESPEQKLARVAQEVGTALRKQVSGRWGGVRTARRSSSKRHVWRFRPGSGQPDRFLHLSHRAMVEGDDPTSRLLGQLKEAGWLERMQRGPETSFRLGASGELRARN